MSEKLLMEAHSMFGKKWSLRNAGLATAGIAAGPAPFAGVAQPVFISTAASMGHDEPAPPVAEQPMAISPEAAARLIGAAERFVRLPSADLAYAEGRMDTTKVRAWVGEADWLLVQADEAFVDGRMGRAVAYAEAARALAGTADMLMAQTLGADNMPSQQGFARKVQPRIPLGQGGISEREQVSRQLLRTYEGIADCGAHAGGDAAAAAYLKQAETTYTTAYAAYLDGNYRAASDAGWVAEGLLHVAEQLVAAANGRVNLALPADLLAQNI